MPIRNTRATYKIGQATKALSIPVVLASDQGSLEVFVTSLPLPDNAAKETGGNLETLAGLIATYGEQEGLSVHQVGTLDSWVKSNIDEGSAIGIDDAIPVAGEDPSGNKQNVQVDANKNLQVVEAGKVYAHIVEDVNGDGTLIYEGWADTGTSTGSVEWRIRRIVESGSVGSPPITSTTEWADGNANFDNEWDNRASLSYS